MTPSRWLLRVPSEDSSARLFCFPYSGLGASMYNRWPRWIGRMEVCPVQLPGRENRLGEPHYGTYPELAEHLAEALLPYLDRPFLLFGHCAGALPAFETARRLGALAGSDLPGSRRLVVSAQVAPHDCPHDRFLGCTDAELMDELRQLALARGAEADPAWLELALAVLRKDLDASGHYGLDDPVQIPVDITVLHWSGDAEVTWEELAGWRLYGRDVRFGVLEGGHYEFLQCPDSLVDLLSGELAGTRPGSGAR